MSIKVQNTTGEKRFYKNKRNKIKIEMFFCMFNMILGGNTNQNNDRHIQKAIGLQTFSSMERQSVCPSVGMPACIFHRA